MDRRRRPLASPPDPKRRSKYVRSNLNADDYRKLYELMVSRNTSMEETIRQLIREASP